MRRIVEEPAAIVLLRHWDTVILNFCLFYREESGALARTQNTGAILLKHTFPHLPGNSKSNDFHKIKKNKTFGIGQMIYRTKNVESVVNKLGFWD